MNTAGRTDSRAIKARQASVTAIRDPMIRARLALVHSPLASGSPAKLTTASIRVSAANSSSEVTICTSVGSAALRPVQRLSTVTEWPPATSAATKRLPTNPVPPVTSTALGAPSACANSASGEAVGAVMSVPFKGKSERKIGAQSALLHLSVRDRRSPP